MVVKRININADLGEGTGQDQAIMPFIASCNIACGGHYGTRETIMQTIRLAQLHGVKVGAHPAYPDRANFGRVVMAISPQELQDSLIAQIKLFINCCSELGVTMNHIKPHGALYNHAAEHSQTYQVLVKVYKELQLTCPMYALPNSLMATDAEHKIPVIAEAFIDRQYTNKGTLVSRNTSDALIESSKLAWDQLQQLVLNQSVVSNLGAIVPIAATTFCIHGDTPQAVSMLEFIHANFSNANFILDK